MAVQEEILTQLQQLDGLLQQNHPGTETAQYVHETLQDLTHSEGVAFKGRYEAFVSKSSLVKMADDFDFNDDESALWLAVKDHQQVGNDKWGIYI